MDMFQIQEDHVRMTLIVGVTLNVSMTNVFHPFATKTVIVDRATNALLENVSLDVYIKDNVRRTKIVLITIVPFHQVIICVIYSPFWQSLTEINKLC